MDVKDRIRRVASDDRRGKCYLRVHRIRSTSEEDKFRYFKIRRDIEWFYGQIISKGVTRL